MTESQKRTPRVVFAAGDELPDPVEYGWTQPPGGCHYGWVPDWLGMRAVRDGNQRPCRMRLSGPGHRYCGSPSVLIVDRGYFKRQEWHYCPDHTFGRIIVDGVVLCVKAVEDDLS